MTVVFFFCFFYTNDFFVKIFIKISIYLLLEHKSIKIFLVSFVREALVNFTSCSK